MATPAAGGDDSQSTSDQVTDLLDAAHDAFYQGDYAAALKQCDQAIALQPNDVLLHEFRGLALFALRRYDEAAGAVYAVLSAGPGWDWTTLDQLLSRRRTSIPNSSAAWRSTPTRIPIRRRCGSCWPITT